MDESEFVTYRGDRIPHPKEQRRYLDGLRQDVPDDAGPDEVPPGIEVAISDYYGKIHGAIDARVACDMMRDPDPVWRREGLHAAFRLKDAALSGPALALLDDADSAVRRRAVLAVWHLNAVEAAPTLLRMLAHDPDEHVRAFSATTLGELHTGGAVEGLVEALKDASDKVITASCLALHTYNDARAIDPLLQVMQTHTSWHVRYHALRTLAELGCRDQAMLSALDRLSSDTEEMANLRDLERRIEGLERDAVGLEDETGEPHEPYESFDDLAARLRREIPAGG
jgi:hypothetical protein